MKLPSLFVSHGAPTFALEDGAAARNLLALGSVLDCPRAVLVISAHWRTLGLEVTTHPLPPTLHDFAGFPDALYQLRYPAPGSPEVAREVLDCLTRVGLAARPNPGRGLDHGCWVPLMHLYPAAEVPVLALSLPLTASIADLEAVGRALSPLRASGVLILGSGSVTHNLRDLGPEGPKRSGYATAFMDWMAKAIADADLPALRDYRRLAPGAARAHPTEEHLAPLFVAIGAGTDDWSRSVRLWGGLTYGVLGMDAYAFGVPEALLAQIDAINTAGPGQP